MRDLQTLSMPGALPSSSCEHDAAALDHRASACHSRRSSGQSSAASPTSLTFSSAKRHSRGPSSSSSLSSSPPRHDSWESHKRTAPASGLPYVAEVAEDAMEPHSACSHDDSSAAGFAHWSRHAVSNKPALAHASASLEGMHDAFYGDSELAWEHHAKRRRSGDYSFNDFASRIVTRFPSLSKRSRERKRASMPVTPLHFDGSEAPSPSPASPRLARSRSSSRARSLFRRSSEMDLSHNSFEQQQQLQLQLQQPEFPSQIDTIAEDEPLDDSHSLQGLGIFGASGDAAAGDVPEAEAAGMDQELAPPDELQRVWTPLLPALMTEETSHAPHLPPDAVQTTPIYAPSPVREGGISSRTSLVGTPQLGGHGSPGLSQAPSVASFHQRKRTATEPSSDVPPMVIAEPNDEWAESLGHANFTIYPAPYRAREPTLEACEQLLRDWEEARQEYSKHLGRTNTHFGATSQTYRLTEQKWAGVDGAWKRSYELATAEAARHGEVADRETRIEPAPVAVMPSMSDPRGEGKFPTMGDEDIVGPMTQVAAPAGLGSGLLRRRPSTKAKILKMFGFMTPSSAMNRI